ncbi:hypothetical protein FF1_030302 [Malus domestica]
MGFAGFLQVLIHAMDQSSGSSRIELFLGVSSGSGFQDEAMNLKHHGGWRRRRNESRHCLCSAFRRQQYSERGNMALEDEAMGTLLVRLFWVLQVVSDIWVQDSSLLQDQCLSWTSFGLLDFSNHGLCNFYGIQFLSLCFIVFLQFC